MLDFDYYFHNKFLLLIHHFRVYKKRDYLQEGKSLQSKLTQTSEHPLRGIIVTVKLYLIFYYYFFISLSNQF